jgi:site-specific DNA-methyltransferase (adenine-specific)
MWFLLPDAGNARLQAFPVVRRFRYDCTCPVLHGRDIKRYSYEFACLYLINTHNGIPSKNIPPVDIKQYPVIKKHLDKHWEKIKNREDQGITPENQFCLTDEGMVILDSMAFLSNIERHKYWLLAFLNSNLIYYRVKWNVHEYGNSGFRLSNQYVENIPIPKPRTEIEYQCCK